MNELRKRRIELMELAREKVKNLGIESINCILDNYSIDNFLIWSADCKFGELFSKAEQLLNRKLIPNEVIIFLYLLEGFERNNKTACFILRNIADSYANSEYRENDILYYYADLLLKSI